MKLDGETRIAGVIGHPIAHSLSPRMMNAWIRAVAINAAYIALSARENLSVDDLRSLSRTGLTGLNVTLPFKTLAAEAADQKSIAVENTGAANLLIFEAGSIHAFNTDIDGIHFALGQAGFDLTDARVLVLGAGGVARAVCEAARQGGAVSVTITNRTAKKADQIATLEANFSTVPWESCQSAAEQVDLIINATSLGLDGKSHPDLDWSRIPEKTVAFDTLYTPETRPFLEFARQTSHQVIDGLPMLIGQGRPSFGRLFGCEVPDIDVETKLREALAR